MKLHYNNVLSGVSNTAQYNGNIAAMEWLSPDKNDIGMPNYKQAYGYSYDANGNMTMDKNKKLKLVEYNYLNLPSRLTGEDNKTITYIYDANGQKLKKTDPNGKETHYAGAFVYNGGSLDYILHSEGMYQASGAGTSSTGYHYNLKDHLGNVRLVVNAGNTVVDQTDYYPFGMNMTPRYSGGLNNKYKYNGKELQEDQLNGEALDWYDYGARFYDASLGRWHTIDPLTEKYPSESPYVYVGNNPIVFLDPDGREKWNTTLFDSNLRSASPKERAAYDKPVNRVGKASLALNTTIGVVALGAPIGATVILEQMMAYGFTKEAAIAWILRNPKAWAYITTTVSILGYSDPSLPTKEALRIKFIMMILEMEGDTYRPKKKETQPKPEPKPEPKSEPKPEPKREPKREPKSEPEPKPEPKPDENK